MAIETDAGGGRAVGSRMRLAGRVLGIDLAVEGEVTERQPPYRKVWQTLESRAFSSSVPIEWKSR